MAWATRYIDELKKGNPVTFRPRGNSMSGIIESGQLVRVVPRGTRVPVRNDVVLCKVNGQQYLHLVQSVDSHGRVAIGNARGNTNGKTTLEHVYGFWDRTKVTP